MKDMMRGFLLSRAKQIFYQPGTTSKMEPSIGAHPLFVTDLY